MGVLRGHSRGQIGGRFEIVGPLGQGGYGAVHEATDALTGQRVAVKELRRAGAQGLWRFKQEFRSLAGLHHPNLVELRELFEHEGRWYIVMELVQGQDLLSHIRAGQPANDNGQRAAVDEARLCEAFTGTARGLMALHEHGVLHRDLKPTNVCVTDDGRAVLLDFGLATSIDPQRQSTFALGAGTAAYMAPEQAVGANVGPAADWYALGTCLFETLTGRLPFEGASGLRVMMDKQASPAPRVGEIVPDVPPALDALCAELLATDPAARPDGRTVLQTLAALGEHSRHGAIVSTCTELPGIGPIAGLVPFAGREAEVDHLLRALDATQQGEPRVVLIEGESGVGKSALVSQFLARARAQWPALEPLSSRCYENENLSYKAFDGCVDQLARLLARMDAEDAAALLPRHAGLLCQLFPVLGQVQGLARARGQHPSAEPTARRLEAFGALAELLSRLAEDRPLVLTIDDLQWADAESFRLLQALIEDRARPAVLIIATVRPRQELDPELLEWVTRVRNWHSTDVLSLHGLPRPQAEQLARELLGSTAPAGWARVITEESQGHPLFLQELVHFAQSRETGTGARLTLDAALGTRLGQLDAASRALLDLVALAGRPYGLNVFANALDAQDVEVPLKPLLAARIVRLRRGHELMCLHDRLRQVAIRLIPRPRLRLTHGRLAAALAREPDADVAEQARHWDLAGEVARAVEAYDQASARALSALAFSRAAELAGRALDLIDDRDHPAHAPLLVRRARALAASGLNVEAADLYARAASSSRGETRIRLRSNVANLLMMSARSQQGLTVARDVLGEVGVSLPLDPARALLRYAWERLRQLLLGSKPRHGGTRHRLALEVISSLKRSVGLLYTPGYLALSVQHLRLALGTGGRAELADAYATQAWLQTVRGGSGQALLDLSRRLAEEIDTPELLASQALSEGASRLHMLDMVGAEECLRRAHRLLQTHCPTRTSDLALTRLLLGTAWYHLSKHARFAAEVDVWLTEARERRDHFGVSLLLGVGFGFVRLLMRDEPERALAELEEARVNLPEETYSFAHLGYLIGMQLTLTYQGGSSAHQWLRGRPELRSRSFVLNTPLGRGTLLWLEIAGSLTAAVEASAEQRRDLFRRARRLSGRLARSRSNSHAYAKLALAQIQACEGDLPAARRTLAEVHSASEGHKPLAKVNAGYLEGLLEGGEGGRAKIERALRFHREQGWTRPEKAVEMELPLAPLLREKFAGHVPQPRREAQRYQILSTLGAGGYGYVTEALDTHTGRHVALKELTHTGPAALARFKREFRAAQEVHHPNLVRAEALFQRAGTWYMVMELAEGQDLLTYVRVGGELDPARVVRAFSGLVQGLMALHQAGLVHRDVTPENVRVDGAGHAVLVDLGLIAREGSPAGGACLGTALHAAPEQLTGADAHRSADVYAVGSCLYQALTGRPPFAQAPAAELAERKSEHDAPAAVCAEAPALLSLSLKMLARDPALRPDLSQVAAALARSRAVAPRRADSLSPETGRTDRAPAFYGRDAELGRLEHACLSSHGSARLVLVRGESGLGKSTLMSQLSRRVRRANPHALVLASRCYENDQTTLKAFDGAVDQLAATLVGWPHAACRALLPRRAALLGQLFPVLLTVPALAELGKKGLPVDPAAQQLASLSAFTALLNRLAARCPTVVLVDDLHWADAESFSLLEMVLQRCREGTLTLIATVRSDAEVSDEAASHLERLQGDPACSQLSLASLDEEATRRLAVELYGGALAEPLREQLLRESKGHPLFLRELVERLRQGPPQGAGVSLDDALRAKIDALDPVARTLLDLTALRGRPVREEILAAALARDALPRDSLITLLAQNLLREGAAHELSCFHDRIREVVLRELSHARAARWAGRLAEALTHGGDRDPAECARLWQLSGDGGRAAQAFEQAGDQAQASLRFAHAERHYRTALQLLEESGTVEEGRLERLTVQRAHALSRMGQSREAAGCFIRASTSADALRRAQLRVWAAQQLIQSAQVDEGLALAREVLAQLNMPLPASDGGAKLQLVARSLGLRLRDARSRTRRQPLSDPQRLALEALHELSSPVRTVSFWQGTLLVDRYLRMALDSGDPEHCARARAYAALSRAVRSPTACSDDEFAAIRALADSVGEPLIVSEVETARGLACQTRGAFHASVEHLAFAQDLLQWRCAGRPWQLTAARMYLGLSWLYVGDYGALAQRAAAWLEEARARKDPHAAAAIAGYGHASLRHLLRGDVHGALSELDEAMAPWAQTHFGNHHFGALSLRLHALAMHGGDALLSYLDAHDAALRAAPLMRTRACRGVLLAYRATAQLSCIDGHVHERHPRLKAALSTARALTRLKSAGSPSRAALVRAALHALLGRSEDAIRAAREARANRPGEPWRQGALYLEGLVEGGDAGAQKREQVVAWLEQRGHQQPERYLRCLVPGYDALRAR